MSDIRRLPDDLVSRIAAGEVIERPGAAVKELVENAIDAGATTIDVRLDEGGRDGIWVTDDGRGMDPGELTLAVERHATSKLPTGDLTHIETLGFRGEAFPSIGSVSRMTITSRTAGADQAWAVTVDGAQVAAPIPAALAAGTRVEVRDLFHAVPARLKFLKQPRTEFGHAADAIKRVAMAFPHIAFSVADGERTAFRYSAGTGDLFAARLARLGQVMGREFADNALVVDAERDGVRLTGYAGVPTLNRRNAQAQYLFVNGRPVRDRLLLGAVRGAYQDLLARDRHPMLALFLEIGPEWVDVNVHPTKAEVRFRDAAMVRGLIVGALRHALAEAGHRASTTASVAVLGAARPGVYPGGFGGGGYPTGGGGAQRALAAATEFQSPQGFSEGPPTPFANSNLAPAARLAEEHIAPDEAHPLGAARAQLHATYIVAETSDGMIIVDQHAAHERLVHERIKAQMAATGIARQLLLSPVVVDLPESDAALLAARAGEFEELGLVMEAFGPGAVVVREVPALLGDVDVNGLIRDMADDLRELDEALALKDRLAEVCATLACHSSVRAGRLLNGPEMNALLREMEVTPNAGQCSHGRPTYVELKRADIERLFGRR
ncbi:MAG: DNA mismatch repair endonuclease MutL [Alphaproteobacteria bacterium]|nr:DNA mismatch repair endonuclease MutL [Alphaproteobacteria bacterium]